MERLRRLFIAGGRIEGEEEEEQVDEGFAGTFTAPTTGQSDPSPDGHSCRLPTAAELAAMFPPRNHLDRDTTAELTRAYRHRTEESKPPPEVPWTFFSARMLGKRISGPILLRRQEMFPGDHARRPRRRLPTPAELAAAHKRNQAIRRDRQRRTDLAPEAYRESSKLDETSTGDALRSRLAELGASTPSCVYVDEVSKDQTMAANKNGRLSMYADSRGRHIAEIFTDDEFDNLAPDGYQGRGRDMPVFDREGRRYDFEFTYSEEHGYCRLTGVGAEYQRFMVGNNVVHDVEELGKKMTMQIFAFRSPKLLPEGKGFHDHQDGALGVIVLFSESEDEYAEWIELDDDSMTVEEMVEHIRQNQKAAH